jgi:hypothetical protein
MPGDSKPPPPAGGHPTPPLSTSQLAMTPERTGDDAKDTLCRMRSFEEIVAQEKQNRNILIVKLTKIVKFVDGKEVKDKSLTMGCRRVNL